MLTDSYPMLLYFYGPKVVLRNIESMKEKGWEMFTLNDMQTNTSKPST